MRVKGIKLINLRNDEHFQFNKEHIALVSRYGAEALGIAPLFKVYKRLFNDEDAAMKKIRASDFTYRIKEADRKRDAIFGGMVLVNSGNLKHFKPAISGAARRIKIVFDTYGNLSRKPLSEQTAAVINILQDLRGAYWADVCAVSFEEWVAELEATNNAVLALIRARDAENVAKVSIVLKDARAKVDAAYRKIVERVNAAVIIEGAAKYENYIDGLNIIIDRCNIAMKVREGRARKKRVIQTANPLCTEH